MNCDSQHFLRQRGIQEIKKPRFPLSIFLGLDFAVFVGDMLGTKLNGVYARTTQASPATFVQALCHHEDERSADHDVAQIVEAGGAETREKHPSSNVTPTVHGVGIADSSPLRSRSFYQAPSTRPLMSEKP